MTQRSTAIERIKTRIDLVPENTEKRLLPALADSSPAPAVIQLEPKDSTPVRGAQARTAIPCVFMRLIAGTECRLRFVAALGAASIRSCGRKGLAVLGLQQVEAKKDGLMEQFIGTMPVAEKQRFDVARLESYLLAHVDGFSGALQVEQFKGGQSNPTYRLAAGGKRYVMRSKPAPAAKLLPSAHAVEREFRVISAL